MQIQFEHFAVTTMIGQDDAPPRANGKLCFSQAWERRAFGVALALSKTGHFDWEDFRQNLIVAISEWERTHALDDTSWSYYDLWLTALGRVLVESHVATAEEITAGIEQTIATADQLQQQR